MRKSGVAAWSLWKSLSISKKYRTIFLFAALFIGVHILSYVVALSVLPAVINWMVIVASSLVVGIVSVLAVFKCERLVRALGVSNKLRKDAEHLSRMKSLFLANTSHEIRTSLGSMIGFARLLEDPELGFEERRKYIEIIQKAGTSLTEVTNDILDISKIESGHLSIEKSSVSLLELLDDLKGLLTLRCEEKQIGLIFHIEKGLPERVYTDPLRLRQILLNVLGNAIKFTQTGWVSLEARVDGDQILFDVRDTGVGIPESARELIFEPFRQSGAGLSRQFGGTGLGVPLSKHLAGLLGGDLQLISSNLGRGSHFQVRIQLEKSQFKPALSVKKQAGLSGTRVLVVDDSEDNCCLIRAILEDRGCDVCTMANVKEAIEKASTFAFDAILMDLQMPLMNGIEAVKILRGKGITTPVIALTASVMAEDVVECEKAGFNDFESKPVQFESLVDKISKYCRYPTFLSSIKE